MKPEEVVHHIDLNKRNNMWDNLMVFASKADHTRFHKYNCNIETIFQTENGSYVCIEDYFKKKVCPTCGKVKDEKAKYCSSCRKIMRSSSCPSREVLLNSLLISNGDFKEVGRQYDVSENAVRKWCKRSNLSVHSFDYRLK